MLRSDDGELRWLLVLLYDGEIASSLCVFGIVDSSSSDRGSLVELLVDNINRSKEQRWFYSNEIVCDSTRGI